MNEPYIQVGTLDSLNHYLDALKNGTFSNRKRRSEIVSVVFLTWNRDNHLLSVIESFRNFANKVEPHVKIEYVSVDNGSTNKSIFKILNKFNWDVKIRNDKNYGIRHALDQAFSRSHGEYILCLEDDWLTLATKPFLGPSIRIMDEYRDIGGVRLKENLQLAVERKIENGEIRLFPDNARMERYNLRWRGK